MKKQFLFLIITIFFCSISCSAQKSSFMVLGDIHYDLLEDHDMEWLSKKPGDLRQVTEGYAPITKNVWPSFSKILRDKVQAHNPKVKAVLQLGDLSEGLAGSVEKAQQMARSTVKAVNEVNMPVPWIIIKGNHDITGPGAPEAFNEHYIAMFREQLNNPDINSANYSHQIGDNLFVCVDPWDKKDVLDILEKNLTSSNAKNKFVLIHEPVIPVNERCWHVYRKDNVKRERLLKILAQNKVIVLCAHLHLYSVVKRDTEYGSIVQILVNSVIRDKKLLKPSNIITEYGSSLAKNVPDWQPESMEERIKWLDDEAVHVTFFKQMDLPGYGILTTDSDSGEITLDYYAGFGEKPYDSINISDLVKK